MSNICVPTDTKTRRLQASYVPICTKGKLKADLVTALVNHEASASAVAYARDKERFHDAIRRRTEALQGVQCPPKSALTCYIKPTHLGSYACKSCGRTMCTMPAHAVNCPRCGLFCLYCPCPCGYLSDRSITKVVKSADP